jgi:hypothetical protein
MSRVGENEALGRPDVASMHACTRSWSTHCCTLSSIQWGPSGRLLLEQREHRIVVAQGQ